MLTTTYTNNQQFTLWNPKQPLGPLRNPVKQEQKNRAFFAKIRLSTYYLLSVVSDSTRSRLFPQLPPFALAF